MSNVHGGIAGLLFTRLVLAAAIVAVLESASTLQADEFTIDPNSSVLNFSGVASDGSTLLPQSAGSFTSHPSGTVVADIVAGTITFPGGSQSTLSSSNGPFAPLNEPANFAGTGPATVFAIRNDIGDIVGAARPIDGGGNFSATAVLPILGGSFDYTAGIFSGSVDLTVSPAFTNNVPVLQGLLQQVGDQLILTIPIDTSSELLINGVVVGTAHYTGETVARMTIPEPSSAVLAVFGIVAFAVRGWRRWKR